MTSLKNRASFKAGFLYFLILFLVGFLFGTIRVLLVVPRIGELWAVLFEVPLMLAISWWVCRKISLQILKVWEMQSRILMGGSAFLLLILSEILLSLLVFDRTAGEYFQGFTTLAGLVGLLGQIAFGFIPILQRVGPKTT
jgi:hypothetical protein